MMTMMSHGDDVFPTILCCICGVEIQQNPCNMCVSCLKDKVDITDGIHKQLTIHNCRNCGRWLCPPWQDLQLESKELMATCLRKITGLSKVKLIDASWIWTEPHSQRLKVKITIQKEVMNNAVLQQATIVEFTIRNQQCVRCQANFAQGAWHAVVQVRQRASHKRTFFFLEQLLLKYNAHAEAVNIVTFRDGMDFYFPDKQHGVKFVDFLSTHVPTKSKYSRKLVSADHSANTANFKHNHIVEIVPTCKDDLLILPKELATTLSNISRLVLVRNVGADIHVFDPFTCEKREISSEKYWRQEFLPVMTSRQLIRFVVLSIDVVPTMERIVRVGELNQNKKRVHSNSISSTASFMQKKVRRNTSEANVIHQQVYRPSSKQKGGHDKKMQLIEVTVAREKDFGVNDTQFTVVCHLGNVLREGDIVLGYDITTSHWAQEGELEEIFGDDKHTYIPDILLVRKHYPTKGERKWLLKQLSIDERYSNQEQNTASAPTGGSGTGKKKSNKESLQEELHMKEYEEFLQEVETDRELRKHINVYKKPKKEGRFKGEKKLNKVIGSTKDEMEIDKGLVKDGEEDDEDEWEDCDEDDEDEDQDDDLLQLDELLDDMVVSENITSSKVDKMMEKNACTLTMEEAEEQVSRSITYVNSSMPPQPPTSHLK